MTGKRQNYICSRIFSVKFTPLPNKKYAHLEPDISAWRNYVSTARVEEIGWMLIT
jgi:hypothetical protein